VAIEPAGLGEEPRRSGGLVALLFTLPGVQRAFYDRLTTRTRCTLRAREPLHPEFGVPDEYVEYGAETARMEGASGRSTTS
jgi:hypothetical protein